MPILNNKAQGKVIEQTTQVMPSKQDKPVKRDNNKLVYTHFLSIPINSPKIRENYEILKKQVTFNKVTGINEQCWQR